MRSSHSCSYHVIIGDVNIDLLCDCEYSEHYKNVFTLYGIISYINSITRPASGTCLDHFLVRASVESQDVKILPFIVNSGITDHFPIALLLADEKLKNTKAKVKQEIKRYIDYPRLRDDLGEDVWTDLYQLKDANSATNLFVETLKAKIERNTTEIIKHGSKIPRKKWITPTLLKEIAEKNKLYREVSKNAKDEELKRAYGLKKKKLRKAIDISRREYIDKILGKDGKTSETLWKFVNEICGKKKEEIRIPKIRTDKEQMVENPKEIAEIFNSHYTKLGKDYADKIISPEDFSDDSEFIERTMFMYPTDAAEVGSIIDELKTKKAAGFDGIGAKTLKEIKSCICKPLSYLSNLYFET